MLLTIIYLFLFGLIVGSFLNVAILRYNTGRSLAGRSGCFSCRHQLGWTELVPVISFLGQGGRCRHCGSKISWQYPLVELSTGILFALSAWKFYPYFGTVAFYCVLMAVLIFIVVHDLRHQIIANEAAYLLIGLAIISPVFRPSDLLPAGGAPAAILYGLLGGFILFAVFFALWFFSRGRWMGFGDAKLAFALGALLGPKGSADAVVVAFWLGALVGLGLIALSKIRVGKSLHRRYSIKSEVPFAPFLAAGLLLNLFFGLSVLAF
ncbi:MAG: prepilin peptidase [Candidatus Vogelbacteria bacterium]|nr:prepilin peptidase [Candidatus Vogelbacteria bacterium]